jgi:hypothetical protein
MFLRDDQRRNLNGPVPTGLSFAGWVSTSPSSNTCRGMMPKMYDAMSGP